MNTNDNKEEFHYFNDEWNLKPEELIEKYWKILDKDGNPQNIVLREKDKEVIKEYFNSKNNKPDGRRYKK
jgi:hypothetical protein